MKNGMLQILSIALPTEPDNGSAFKSELQRVHFALSQCVEARMTGMSGREPKMTTRKILRKCDDTRHHSYIHLHTTCICQS